MRHDKALEYHLLTRFHAQLFSKDPSTKVGAIFLQPDSYAQICQGYNGFPRGINEKNPERWQRPQKYLYVEHAERNGIYNAARMGVSLEGSIAIITLFPCADCARGLIQVGVRTIVCPKPEQDSPLAQRWNSQFEVALEMLTEANIEMLYVEDLLEEAQQLGLSLPDVAVNNVRI